MMKGYFPSNRWEQEVYRQLQQQLPHEWIVVSNVTWSKVCSSDDSGAQRYVRDGEADFVVLVPDLGFVVLEVKGSRTIRIDEDGRWYRHDPHRREDVLITKPPPAQATGSMHELKNAIAQRAGWTGGFPGLFGYLVVYPQGELRTPIPELLDASTIVLANQMHDLQARIRACLLKRGPADDGRLFATTAFRQALDVLTSRPYEVVKADTTDDLEEDSSGIELLTRQQHAALRGIFSFPRVAVTGPAGSGKTLLALWRLSAFLEEGLAAAYLCYNVKLAEHLRIVNPSLASNIHSVDKWLRDLLVDAGIPQSLLHPQPGVEGFFDEILPNMVVEYAERVAPARRPKAIIVDEGQDFGESRLLAIQELLGDHVDSRYLYFADQGQDVYSRASAGDVGAEVLFTLHHNCRNTVRINGTANRFAENQVPSMPGMPDGVEPTLSWVRTSEGVAKHAWELARDWASAGGSVAILSPHRLENSSLANARRGHGMSLTEDLTKIGQAGAVYFSTIKTFKGIEADSVIVIDVVAPSGDSLFTKEDLYVATTRAKVRLAFVSSAVDGESWERDFRYLR